MTQTKLEIIGPYTPEHDGPFCTRGGEIVELRIRDGREPTPLCGYIGDEEGLTTWLLDGRYINAGETSFDLMNAREVPVAREFWVNEYHDMFGTLKLTEQYAKDTAGHGFIRTIHVREVLPGEE